MNEWVLIYEGYDPESENLREALTTLGNGYFATRGACAQCRDDGVHYPGTYLAGGYDRLVTEIHGRKIENEDLVNMPNWLVLDFRLPGDDWFRPDDWELLDYEHRLDIRKGVLHRTMRVKDAQDRVLRVEEERLVHMKKMHLAALKTVFTAENFSGELEIGSGIDGQVTNNGVERYQELRGDHLEPVSTGKEDDETVSLRVRTKQSRVEVAMAARTRVFSGGERLAPERRIRRAMGAIFQEFGVELREGEPLVVEKIVALYTSRDSAISEPGIEATRIIRRLDDGFKDLRTSHVKAWDVLWKRFEIVFWHKEGKEKGDQTERIMRLYIFHLLQTTSINTMDLDVGIPSRGWHGEAYRGHIFWDELFIFPLFNIRLPEITRSLLMYRYRRLDEARAIAEEQGFYGAMYPWQSGSDGREESQKIHLNPRSGRWIPDNTHLQRHVNAAIAYNIHQYHQVSGDMEFLSFYGAEMFLEIARFWSCIATFNEKTGRYEIHGVVGPDEYHTRYPDSDEPGLNNNAYTNVMAAWVLDEALNILEMLPEDRHLELCDQLEITAEEKKRWRDISRKMTVPFHDDGIISQFEGYEDLKEFDWDGHREKYGDIQRLDRILEAEGDTPNRYKASKQADVLMLFYLHSADVLRRLFNQMGYDFPTDLIPRNIEYYIARTSHGSTLSFVVHAWVMSRLNRMRSWKLFESSLMSDVRDIQGGTTPEGIHSGAMAGTVDIMQRGYTDMETRGEVLRFNPRLPAELEKLCMRIQYRGVPVEVQVTQAELRVTSLRTSKRPIRIGYLDREYELRTLETRVIPLVQPVRDERKSPPVDRIEADGGEPETDRN